MMVMMVIWWSCGRRWGTDRGGTGGGQVLFEIHRSLAGTWSRRGTRRRARGTWGWTDGAPRRKLPVASLRRIGRSARLSAIRQDSWTSDRWGSVMSCNANSVDNDRWHKERNFMKGWLTCTWVWQDWDHRPQSPSAVGRLNQRQAWSHLLSAWWWGRRTGGRGHSRRSPQPGGK